MIDEGLRDRDDRLVTLREIDAENWRAVADVAPLDTQRRYVAALAARYLLLSLREGRWQSLGIYADEEVVGHLMWGVDPADGSHWVGGVMVDAAHQSRGLGRAAMQTMLRWLGRLPEHQVTRLSYHPNNLAARQLYRSLGFVPASVEANDDEVVVELPGALRQPASGHPASGQPTA